MTVLNLYVGICCKRDIFTSTSYGSLYFLGELIVIHSSVKTDMTDIYRPLLSIGRNVCLSTYAKYWTARNNHDDVRQIKFLYIEDDFFYPT